MKTSVLVIDNFDSFVYNLIQYLEELNCEVTVRNNQEITLSEVENFHKILLSPGPGVPSEAGKLEEIIRTYSPTKSILGVCLGQQAIGEVFGAKLKNLNQVYHGVHSTVTKLVQDERLYESLPEQFEVGRYHSWIVSEENFPERLEITTKDEEGNIMSLRHKTWDVRGVQFHPESILTPHGKRIIENWIKN